MPLQLPGDRLTEAVVTGERMLSSTVPGAFFFTLLWLVWVVMGIATLVVFYRGMTALATIPERLERIEQAIANRESAVDDRAT